ncbi:hypothetical protein NEHOM01_0473 [Nematocida homosporus]|uniref:uncharacterized protein n=1 Tax=Nematocida homosporus TaxID=1912981 RepID=UPI00221E789F|nr:uncharacterized protein NEHOM01_0473 [Nematocida homosporus]KAI5184922.1 hypothetical protein NEHOM01_0473 [Nematocida homosporus]
MVLSRCIIKPSSLRVDTGSKTMLDVYFVSRVVSSPKTVAGWAPVMIGMAANKPGQFKAMAYWVVVGLGVWLMLLSSVCSSNVLYNDSELNASNGLSAECLPKLPTAFEMMHTLASIGFMLELYGEPIRIKHYYAPPAQSKIHLLPSNPMIYPCALVNNTPLYIIEWPSDIIGFVLRAGIDKPQAMTILKELRKIAVIRIDCPPSTHACISIDCLGLNNSTQPENLQILSRIVNMIYCPRIRFCFDLKLPSETDISQTQLTLCLYEAQDTIKHADPTSTSSLKVSTEMDSSLSSLVNGVIPFLRPIIGVRFFRNEFHSIRLIKKLSLVDKYRISFEELPRVACIDLGPLHTPPSNCASISIGDFYFGMDFDKITLIGFEHGADIHSKVALEAHWNVLHYLGKYNETLIEVYTILGFDVTPKCIQAVLGASQQDLSADAWLSAVNAISKISTVLPCCAIQYYAQLYTPTTFANLGISVANVMIEYEEARDDLHYTLKTLHTAHAISSIPKVVINHELICHGENLTNSNWVLQEPVIIMLARPAANGLFEYMEGNEPVIFCQNIVYTTIKLDGSKAPDILNESGSGLVTKCIGLFNRLQNLTAEQLILTNINILTDDNTVTDFNIINLYIKPCMAPRQFKIKTLVLDNVDVYLIYWIFIRYKFASYVDVHILNQRFANLAIAQILCHPAGQMISYLILNDFSELAEVKHHNQPYPIGSFSLFNYVQDKQGENKTTKDLRLDKLYLNISNLDYALYDEVLSKLAKCGIIIPAMPFNDYIKAAPTLLDQASIPPKTELILYNTTFEALKYDFANYKLSNSVLANTNPSQSSPSHKYAVENLFLHFSDSPELLEEDLKLVLRWLAHRFKWLVNIHLVRVRVSENVRATIYSRNYWVNDVNVFNNVQIENGPSNDSDDLLVNLHIRSYTISILAGIYNPTPFFIGMSSTLLPPLSDRLSQTDQSGRLDDSYLLLCQRLTDYLHGNPVEIKCPNCAHAPYKLDANRPTSKEHCPLQTIPKSGKTICHLKCGHAICSTCLFNRYIDGGCPICGRNSLDINLHRVVIVPQSSFVFADDNTGTYQSNPKLFEFITLTGGYLYLYLAYKSIPALIFDLYDEIEYHTPYRILVI